MKNKLFSALIVLLLVCSPSFADIHLGNTSVRANVTDEGRLSTLSFQYNQQTKIINFRVDKYAGPAFGEDIKLSKEKQTQTFSRFSGEKNDIGYAIEYILGDQYIDIVAEVRNNTATLFKPDRLPFTLGINTYMDKYPEWNDQYYPTFFRCEANNFWGYLMTPKGDILTIASPDNIGCYHYDYLNEMYGHYIYTMTLDLLCNDPLPAHHPRPVGVKSGQTKRWNIRLQSARDLNQVQDIVTSYNQASLIILNSHSLSSGQQVEISVNRGTAQIEVTAPSGITVKVGTATDEKPAVYTNAIPYGLYTIHATNNNGKVSTANFYVHPSWEWYMNKARENALTYVPKSDKGNDSCETWYQLFAFYFAEKHNPDPAMKQAGDELLDKVLDRLFAEKDGKMYSTTYTERLQNVSAMVSVLSMKYSVDHNMETLETACKCAEYILSRQHEKGYYGGYGMAHYTSVIYIARSVVELMQQIKPLTNDSKVWRDRYNRYHASVERAISELSERGYDISTEGAATYEDGAVSCTASQLLLWALLKQDQTGYYEKFKKSGLESLESHACLARLLDPDSRSRGATSRYWECWGDIRTPMQAQLSPHGWSGWRLYASYYAYLLTGEYYRLQQFMDAMGTCTQLIDFPTGKLRYAFVVDPQYAGGELLPDTTNVKYGKWHPNIATAGYINQIGDWFGRTNDGNGYLDRSEWEWDGAGTAFEIYKAMEETVLTHAFICANGDDIVGYNCKVEHTKGKVNVYITERLIDQIHVNLHHKQKVNVYRNGQKVTSFIAKKMDWHKVPTGR